jgi:hypothetical protein
LRKDLIQCWLGYQQPPLKFWWLYSAVPGTCRDSTSTRPEEFPYKSFPIQHHSTIYVVSMMRATFRKLRKELCQELAVSRHWFRKCQFKPDESYILNKCWMIIELHSDWIMLWTSRPPTGIRSLVMLTGHHK